MSAADIMRLLIGDDDRKDAPLPPPPPPPALAALDATEIEQARHRLLGLLDNDDGNREEMDENSDGKEEKQSPAKKKKKKLGRPKTRNKAKAKKKAESAAATDEGDDGPIPSLEKVPQHEISSAEDERLKAKSRRQTRRRVTKPKIIVPPPVTEGCSIEGQPIAPFVIKPSGQLLLDYPYLASNTAKLPSLADSGGGESKTPATSEYKRTSAPIDPERPFAKPPCADYINPLLHNVAKPKYITIGKAMPDSIHGETPERLVELGHTANPDISAREESEQLGESGRHKHTNGKTYNFPLCMFGARCVGMVLKIPNSLGMGSEPIRRVLGAFMWPRQFSIFIETGECSTEPMPCVMCHRYHLVNFVSAFLGNNKDYQLAPSFAAQLWGNIPSQIGEYDPDYVFFPGSIWAGMKKPIAIFAETCLRWERSINGRLMINQSDMLYTADNPTSPEMGETLRNFWSGVD